MATRLVTLYDLQRHPEFAGKGISLNMYYDFPDEEEAIPLPESVPIATVAPETIAPETIVPPKKVKENIAPKKVATKQVAPKKIAPKKATTKKK